VKFSLNSVEKQNTSFCIGSRTQFVFASPIAYRYTERMGFLGECYEDVRFAVLK
jgi:hypothetical protein